MIRDTRVFLAVSGIAAALAIVSAVLWSVRGVSHTFIPTWAGVALYVFLAGACIYQIVNRLRNGPPDSFGGLTNRQLWMLKGVLLSVVAIVLVAVLWLRIH